MEKYTVYKTTNIINGKFYIGIHKTLNINDSYLGSGKLLKRAIKKYGKNNFIKEILFVYDTLNEAAAKEKQLVNEQFILNDDNYNVSVGGSVGGKNINGLSFYGRKHTEETKKKISASSKGRKHTEETKKKIAEKVHNNPDRNRKISETLKGRRKSEDTKRKISETLKNKIKDHTYIKKKYKRKYKQQWINNGASQTRIKDTECIPVGWVKGRIF